MSPTTNRTTHSLLRRTLLPLAMLMALAGIGRSQTASACLSSQLSAHYEAADASSGGHRSSYYSFRNNSTSPCMLNGVPAVALIDRAGRRMKITIDKAIANSDVPSSAITLAPGGKAFFEIRYQSCEFTNGAVEQKSRCTTSAKVGFRPPGTKGMLMIRDAIDADYLGVSPLVATLKELGVMDPEFCDGSQLSLKREASDAAMGGARSVFYSFKNISRDPCPLKGWPRVVLLNAAGRPLKVTSSGGEGEPNEPKGVRLAPGEKAYFAINYTSCHSAGAKPSGCKSSAKARITAPGTKRNFIVREVMDPKGPYFDVTALARTLDELGISIKKPKP